MQLWNTMSILYLEKTHLQNTNKYILPVSKVRIGRGMGRISILVKDVVNFTNYALSATRVYCLFVIYLLFNSYLLL